MWNYRRQLAAGALLLVLAALGGWKLQGRGHKRGGTPLPVRRGDLVMTVEVEGALVALHSVFLGPPSVSETQFKISFLAPEGERVKKGQPVLAFDVQTLRDKLQALETEARQASRTFEQERLNGEQEQLRFEQEIAAAQAELGKARLKAEVPPELLSRVELSTARLEVKSKERALASLHSQVASVRAAARAKTESLAAQRDRARARVAELQEAMKKMRITAPQDGVVIYKANWRNEKKKMGDNVWRHERFLELPDLTQMKGVGRVDEADGGRVAVGQPVTFRLESQPDVNWTGRVSAISRTVRQLSWRVRRKVFQLDVALDRTEPGTMRPAMRFRGHIETGREADLLLVPREGVFLRPAGPVAWVRRRADYAEVPLRLGRANKTHFEVLEGLSEGDLVAPADLALEVDT